MGVLDRFRNRTDENMNALAQEKIKNDPEKAIDPNDRVKAVGLAEKSNDNAIGESNVQAGVKAVQAATSVWTKWHLIGAYIMYFP